MTDRSRCIDAAADPVGNGHGNALGFAGRIRQAVDDRVPRVGQDLGGPLYRVLQAGRPAFNEGHGAVLDMVVEEPGFAEDASVFRLGDSVAFDSQFHVIADAAAEGAGGVGDDFQLGHVRSPETWN